MEMSERIKLLRKEKGLTLEEVGNRVGVGKSTVRKWESGQIANMRRDKIALLAAALGVTPTQLMGWDEIEQKEEEPAPTSAEEREEFARLFASLEPENRERILDLMKALLAGHGSGDAPHN